MSALRIDLSQAQFLSRRTKLLKQLRGDVALFVAAPEQTKNRDQDFPHTQNSDFYYLTGFDEPDSALVLLGASSGPRSVLYLRERDSTVEKWNGERLGIKRAKRRFQVDEVRNIQDLLPDLPQLFANARALHYTPGVNHIVDAAVWKLFCTQLAPRLFFPNSIKDARLLTADLRFIKDKTEIQAIKHAAEITAKGFRHFLPLIPQMTSEKHAATVLESLFSKFGGHGLAFQTIVASGKNATTLHHTPAFQPLWKRELLLIDAGATFRGYCGDITRTVPASGHFSKAQAEVYDIVHSALQAAIDKSKPDSSLDSIHEAAVKQLVRGLIELKIIKATTSEAISDGLYRPYFMHRTSHWLGLDVHDISPVSVTGQSGTVLHMPASMRPLVPGNVFTIEPGLYFDPKDTSVPTEFRGIGIRIEEDLLVTGTGCEVLTSSLPSTRAEIENLMN